MASAVFVYLALMPTIETSLPAATLCGVFWLTQRLLSLISLLDGELTRMAGDLKLASVEPGSTPCP